MLLLLRLEIDRPPVPKISKVSRWEGDTMNVLEQKDMRLWFMDLIVFPSETLIPAQLSESRYQASSETLTCVMPRPLHSSSHNSLRVPLVGSK